MKKRRGRSKKPMFHMALGLGVALVATGWYWGGIQSFYQGALQAASVFLGFSSL